jgi:hypothetical protein
MLKLIGMLVALAMFCAMPALAFAQDEEVEQDVTQENETEQDADATGGEGDDGSGGSGGVGADQNATCQQVAGEDADCEIDQSQNFEGDPLLTPTTTAWTMTMKVTVGSTASMA